MPAKVERGRGGDKKKGRAAESGEILSAFLFLFSFIARSHESSTRNFCRVSARLCPM